MWDSYRGRVSFAPNQMNPQSDDHFPGWIREAITNEIREFAQAGAIFSGTYRALYGGLKMTLLAVIRGADRRRIRRLDSGKSCPVCPAAA